MQKPYHDFQTSGQNNSDWKAFFIGGGTDPDSIVGKQPILASFILNIGLPQEDNEFLIVLSRTIAPGVAKVVEVDTWEGWESMIVRIRARDGPIRDIHPSI